MPVKFVNDLQTRITDVGGISAAGTTVNISAGDGAKIAAFVNFAGAEYCYATFKDVAGNRETVKVTAQVTDQLTIARSADGDTARAWAQNDILDFCLCSVALEELDQSQETSQNAAEIAAAKVRLVDSAETLDQATETILTGLETGGRYRIEFELYCYNDNGDMNLDVNFGGPSGIDTGNNYYYHFRIDTTGSAPGSWFMAPGFSSIQISYGSSQNYYFLFGHIEFSVKFNDPTSVVGNSFLQNDGVAQVLSRFTYLGTNDVDRVRLSVASGGAGNRMSGAIRLYKTN